MTPTVAILTRSRDFHAHAVALALLKRGVACSIVETDRLAVHGGMSWAPDTLWDSTINDHTGARVRISDIDLVWCRRLSGDPQLPASLADPAERDVVTRDCRATMLGLFETSFYGSWVSDPNATRRAENKLTQLVLASEVGLQIPKTLISQNPAPIREFCRSLNFSVVAKAVAGTVLTPILAGSVDPSMLESDDALAVSPTIYQEFIRGTRHLRVCCFGNEAHAVMLETDRLDWRLPLDATASPYGLPSLISAQLNNLLRKLGLRMGIVDMKVNTDGEFVFLEINPQGQFLFLEHICGVPLLSAFVDFLTEEVRRPAVAVEA